MQRTCHFIIKRSTCLYSLITGTEMTKISCGGSQFLKNQGGEKLGGNPNCHLQAGGSKPLWTQCIKNLLKDFAVLMRGLFTMVARTRSFLNMEFSLGVGCFENSENLNDWIWHMGKKPLKYPRNGGFQSFS